MKLTMKISYHEYKPSHDLLPYVECFWICSFEGEDNEESPVQRCLPMGMYEILIHLDQNISDILLEEHWRGLPRDFFTGIYDNPVYWKIKGTARLFGIRLKPETFSHLFDVPAASLFSNFTDLETFFGKEVSEFAKALHGRKSITAIIAQTEVFLSKRLAAMQQRRHYIIEAARMIREAKGNITIEEVSSTLSVGIRQLQRSFKDYFGTNPKAYLRIIRFRNAYTSLKNIHEWADITHDMGYADQAHFIREFKEFAGVAPKGIIKNAESFKKKPLELTSNLNAEHVTSMRIN